MMIKKLLIIFCLGVTSVFAFDLKSKPVEVVIPFPPGGGVDITYRHFEKFALSKGIKTVPIYKPGGDGLVAMHDLANGSKDGYRIGFSTSAVQSSVSLREPGLGIVPITAIKIPIGGIVVHSDSNIKTFDQLVSELKINDKINVASGAPGQTFFWTNFFTSKGIPQKNLINYKGSQPIINDLLGKHVDVAVFPIGLIFQYAKNNNLKILAHTGNTKLKDLPDVIPLGKTDPGASKVLELFIVVSPKFDKEISDKWNEILRQYVLDSENQQHFISEYNDPVFFGTGMIAESITNIRQIQNKLKVSK